MKTYDFELDGNYVLCLAVNPSLRHTVYSARLHQRPLGSNYRTLTLEWKDCHYAPPRLSGMYVGVFEREQDYADVYCLLYYKSETKEWFRRSRTSAGRWTQITRDKVVEADYYWAGLPHADAVHFGLDEVQA